ncbi:MAG: GTPase ObgE [Patescibacteria group bacterium]
MLIDEVRLKIRGGHGGDGAVSYKNAKMAKGPTGGDGGDGGDVYLVGVSDLTALRQYRHQTKYSAKNGVPGSNRNKHGGDGNDLFLKVPIGTIVKNLDLKEDVEVVGVDQKILIAHGARGGHGNFYFRSSTNISPREFEHGRKAREFDFVFELKLIADIGLIGLPNAGKSALLNELTSARSQVANYAFTTLEPNLGVYYDLILADIPGLIEGASEGRGLGIKFLRHISRCRALFHLVSSESADSVRDYKTVRRELAKYDKALTKKDEFVFLSKSDLAKAEVLKKNLAKLKKVCPNAIAISVYDWDSLEKVKKILNRIGKQKVV